MSVNTKFEAYKVRREIKRNGTKFIFFKPKKNDIGEPIKESKEMEITPKKT